MFESDAECIGKRWVFPLITIGVYLIADLGLQVGFFIILLGTGNI